MHKDMYLDLKGAPLPHTGDQNVYMSDTYDRLPAQAPA